jgi:hypothetical protein
VIWLWWILGIYVALCYAGAVYIVLWKTGIDEYNIDAIRWHIKEDPIGPTLLLLFCLVAAVFVAVGVFFIGPVWALGKVLGVVIGSD